MHPDVPRSAVEQDKAKRIHTLLVGVALARAASKKRSENPMSGEQTLHKTLKKR